MRAYHLLSASHAIEAISLRRLKLARYNDLNDPFEMMAVNTSIKSFRRALEKTKQDFHDRTGMLCFSRNWSNPVLWSHYGDKHKGIALGFDLNDEHVQEINYQKHRVPLEFKERDPERGFTEEFVDKLMRTKYAHWNYEEEVRVCVSLDESTQEYGLFFYPFDVDVILKEIILGHACQVPFKDVRKLANSLHQNLRVVKARLAFNSFNIVENKKIPHTE